MIAQLDRNFIRARPFKIWARLMAYFLFEGRPITTRGRWINPIVMAGFATWSKMPLSRKPDRPIFIMGVGRSGTTLLGKVLGLHPKVGFLNEPKALWHAALGNDDLIGSYSKKVGRYRMDQADATPPKSRRLHQYYAMFCRLSGCSRVLDKYPETIFRDQFLNAAFPDCKKIVLVRDGWQTTASVAAWSAKNGGESGDWWGANDCKWHALAAQLIEPDPYFGALKDEAAQFTRQEDRAALEWIVTMREALKVKSSRQAKIFLLRFEDLVAAPAAHVAALLDFCGLGWDPKVVAYASEKIAPPRIYPRPNLDPRINLLLNETMLALGYTPEEIT